MKNCFNIPYHESPKNTIRFEPGSIEYRNLHPAVGGFGGIFGYSSGAVGRVGGIFAYEITRALSD